MPRLIPSVIDAKDGGQERFTDIYTRLLQDRIIFLDGGVNEDSASIICAQLLFLAAKDPEKDISLYIMSPGGSVSAGLAIYDTISLIKPDVSTVCMGTAASMGAILLSAGTKGKRLILPHARVMTHQPSVGYHPSTITDIGINYEQSMRYKEILNNILAKNTGQPLEKVIADNERDHWMNAEEAVAYGIVDRIIGI